MSAGLLPAFTTALVLLASMQCAYSTAENKPSGPRSSVELVPSVGRYLGRSSVRPAPSVRHPGEQRRLRQLAKPPPYAVQMEPLVQYSQRDPLYQQSSAAISKKFSSGPGVLVNHHGSGGQVQHSSYDNPQIYVTPQPDYYSSAIPPGYVVLREPEPIIEIIVKEANHTLAPAPSAPVTPAAKKREPVHVFFVKYKKDEHSGQVKYENPVAAVTPSSPPESSAEHHEPEPPQPEYTTPAPPPPSTTLRTVIHPDSETVHVNTGGLRITFGNGDDHHAHQHNHGASSHHGPSGYDQQQPYEQQQGSEPQPVFAQTPERSQPTKRQQPPLPGPRFHFPPTQSRFLTPPPVQPVEDFRTPQFSGFPPQFQQRPNFNNQPPQFTNKLQSPPFQQNFDSFQQQQGRFEPSGKLEAVPFKQQATGKLVVPNSSGRFEAVPFNQPPPFQSNIRLQEPVNGLPPPPPPQTFLRPQPPTFFSSQFNQPAKAAPPPRPQPQPAPQPNFSQQTFVQQVPAVFSQSLPPQSPSFSPPQSAPPSFPKPQPQFQQSQSFPQNFHTSQAPSRPPQQSVTTPIPTTTRHQFPSSPQPTGSGAEIVQSITPSREELQRQQQEQFRREQEYYQEIQKLQQELDQRSKQTTTTPAPPKAVTGTTTRHHHQPQHSTVHAAPSTTTPAPSVSSTSAPAPSNFVLPDEVPEDLRQQLLSSGILSNADIQILDYDKVGDIPIESLPQEALQQFIGATGGQTPAASELRPQYVRAPVDRISTSAPDDNEPAASETVAHKSAVEVKVVRFAPGAGEEAASDLIRDDATTLTEPVELDGQGYSRYLPLQVEGKRFPLPDVPELRNVNVTSVVVLAPVLTAHSTFARRVGNAENVAEVNPDDVQFVAGESLTNLVADPSERNFRLWLEKEKETAPTQQSVILLVSEKPKSEGGQDVFMYDANTARVSKLEGELSSAFVEVALANSSSHEPEDPKEQEATTSAPLTISTGYSKTKH